MDSTGRTMGSRGRDAQSGALHVWNIGFHVLSDE